MQFSDLFPKIFLSESKQIDVLNQEEQENFKNVIRSIGYEVLINWVKGTTKKMAKDSKLDELLKKKKQGDQQEEIS